MGMYVAAAAIVACSIIGASFGVSTAFTVVIAGLILVTIGHIVRKYMGGASYTGGESLSGRTIVITGANSGIGRETARELARRGGRVIMACRDTRKGEAVCDEIIEDTSNKNVECRKLDLASFASIRAFAKDVTSKESHIDILINNAGVMMCPKSLTEDGLEMQMGTNHFGHFLVTNLLLDKIKESATEKEPCRIIFLSSLAHTKGQINFDDLNSEKSYKASTVYEMSKLANVMCANELAMRLAGSNVTVNSAHPGIVVTELGRHLSIFTSRWGKVVLLPFVWLLMKTPVQGAQTSIRLACDDSLKTTTGKYFSDCAEKKPAPQALDDVVGKRLWAVSEVMTKSKKID